MSPHFIACLIHAPWDVHRPRSEVTHRDGMFGPMGALHYGDGDAIHIDDRALAHLKIAIATKLRRNESFTLSWIHADGDPEGRSTIWLHPSIPLRFTFDTTETPKLNAKWIESLMHSANSTGGIQLVDEMIETPAD